MNRQISRGGFRGGRGVQSNSRCLKIHFHGNVLEKFDKFGIPYLP